MTDGVVDQIKQRLDVVEVLGEYLKLTKAGRNFKALCPFHGEKTPSFIVSPERQIWHCFGCGQGGDIFKFVMLMEGIEFPDALRILARRAGVVLKKQDPQIQSQKKKLYEANELATKFFETQLHKTSAGKRALDYLLKRGLNLATIKQWRLGWAHDSWRALYEFLKSRGFKDQEIMSAGLLVEKEESQKNARASRYYDRFRSRIMFPIFDLQGQVIGFAGRIFNKPDSDAGKYINTPQTPLYDKSKVLYGLNFAKNEIRQADNCIFVEGNIDVIMSHQAGTRNTVASSGTALTDEHLKIIKRYTDNLLFAFDADAAGQAATRRGINLALAHDFQIKLVKLKDKDPAEVIHKNPADWQKALSNAYSVRDFYFDSVVAKFDAKTADGRRAIKKEMLPVIKSIASRVEQSEWLKQLAMILKANEKDLSFEMEKIKPALSEAQPFSQKTSSFSSGQSRSRQEWLEERLLGLCLQFPEEWPKVADFSSWDFENQKLAQIFHQLKALSGEIKKEELLDYLKKNLLSELSEQVDYLILKAQQQPVLESSEIQKEMKLCLRELKILKIRQSLISLSLDIQKFQTENNRKATAALLEEFSRLANQLLDLTKSQ